MEQVLSSFQDGLDSRRSVLTTSAHALQTALNVHINQGAEIEKRRAYVDFGATASTAFGLELTDAGLVNFGSAATPVNPVGVTYVQLIHPSDPAQQMTAILCSCTFGGKSWAVAQFANGNVFTYYNGVVLAAMTNGLVLTGGTTNLQVATQFYNYINTPYYQDLGFFASPPVLIGTSYYVDVYSSPGVSFSLVPDVESSAAGTIGTLLISNSSQGTAFSQANFAFSVYMGNTGSLTSVLVSTDNGVTFSVALLGAAVVWASGDTTGYTTALNIAATVSSSLTSLPITAQANNNQITLLADTSLGATPNGYSVKFISSGDFCLDDMVLDFSGVTVFTSSSLLVGSLMTVFVGQTYNAGGTYVQSTPAGTYFWHKSTNDISLSIAGGATFFADNSFVLGATTNITFTGAASTPVTAQLTKMVEILGATITGTTIATFVSNLFTQIRTFCTTNALSYTACVSQANAKQLVVSRNVIVSTNQFYPILASDVTGVIGIVSQIIQTKPILKGSYLTFTASSGIINVSVVGGDSPFLVSYTTTQSVATGTDQYSFTLPNGNPSALTGSFQIALSITTRGIGSHSVQFTISLQDIAGSTTTLVVTIVSAGTSAAPTISSVTFL